MQSTFMTIYHNIELKDQSMQKLQKVIKFKARQVKHAADIYLKCKYHNFLLALFPRTPQLEGKQGLLAETTIIISSTSVLFHLKRINCPRAEYSMQVSFTFNEMIPLPHC